MSGIVGVVQAIVAVRVSVVGVDGGTAPLMQEGGGGVASAVGAVAVAHVARVRAWEADTEGREGERGRGSEADRERERQTHKDRERQRGTERETKGDRGTKRDTQTKHTHTKTERERAHTKTQRDRQTP